MTSPAPAWVIGSGGLLGRQVAARLESAGRPVLRSRVPWHDPEAARATLREDLEQLADLAAGGPWDVAWCAGAGVVATSPQQLEGELDVFTGFLADLAGHRLDGGAGAFFLASSAGGLYAGSSPPPFDESTEPRPLGTYGHTKLAMEQRLVEAAQRMEMPALLGRFANLFGPGQRLDKAQGLVTQVCRAAITGQPMSVYVSLDTRRDYLVVTDAAAMATTGLAGLRDRARTSGELVTVKVLASGISHTIGDVLAQSRRILRRRPPVLVATSDLARVQARDLRLRSMTWPELDHLARTPFAVGVAMTAHDLEARMRAPRQEVS